MEQKAPNDTYEQNVDHMIDIYCKLSERVDYQRSHTKGVNGYINERNRDDVIKTIFHEHMIYINHLVFTDEILTKLKEIQITLQIGFETLANNDAGISQAVLDNFDKQVDDFAASPAGQKLKDNDIITNS